jgi:uncharacterized membrane protein
MLMDSIINEHSISIRKTIYRIGGIAALVTVVIGVLEVAINFLPSGGTPVETVLDLYNQLQTNTFIALRNLGLLNIFMVTLGIPIYFSLYTVFMDKNKEFAAFAMIVSFISAAIFFSTNRALSMLELSQQYALATMDHQRIVLEAAGQAMISVGKSHCPGTFIGFSLGEVAGIIMSLIMLRNHIFSKVTAVAGIIGFSMLLIYEICESFIPSIGEISMIIAMIGGLGNIVWMSTLGFRLLRIEK